MTKSKTIQTLTLVLFLLIVWSPPAGAQTSAAKPAAAAVKPSLDDVIADNLKLGPCKNDERLEAVKKLFIKMGASESDITVSPTKDLQNVILTKKGKTDETVIIGAHYDKVSSGCGIIDNWSGIVILAHIYQILKDIDTQKTYIFAAFDKEEVGLKGSDAMAKAIPKDKLPMHCSMVNLDSFGLGYPYILENASSSKMVKFAKDLGAELEVPVTAVTIEGANSDSASFKKRDIPAITMSALSPNWPQYMHSANDTLANTNTSSVRVGLLFSLEYLKKVDAGSCGLFK